MHTADCCTQALSRFYRTQLESIMNGMTRGKVGDVWDDSWEVGRKRAIFWLSIRIYDQHFGFITNIPDLLLSLQIITNPC